MAIDASIPLQGRPANIAGLVQGFATDVNNARMQQEQLGNQRLAAQGQAEANALKAEELRNKLRASGQEQAAKEAAEFTIRMSSVLDQNPAQAVSMLESRINEMRAQGRDVSNSMRQLEIARADPEAFKRDVASDLVVAERMGFVKPGPARYVTEVRNGVPVQVNTLTGKAERDPSQPSPMEAGLQGLAAATREETLARARLERQKLEREETNARRTEANARVDKLNLAKDALEAAQIQATDLGASVDRALSLAQNMLARGAAGQVLGNIAGTDAADLQATLDELKSNATFTNVGELKRSGVNLGPLTDSDINLASAIGGSFSPKQSVEQLSRNLLRFKARVERSARRMGTQLDRTRKALGINPASDVPEDDQAFLNDAPLPGAEIKVGNFKVRVVK